MKRQRRLLFSILLLSFFLNGCNILGITTSQEKQCDCCTESLFESGPIQDLLDGDNEWMGLILGETKADEIEAIFEDIPHEFCYARQEEDGSHMVCNEIPEKYFDNIGGYVFLHLPEFNCRGLFISWELDKIDEILFSCGDCINLAQLFSYFGEPSYISAWPIGLHDSELATTIFYPQKGLSIGLGYIDPLDPTLTETIDISYISLTLPPQNNKRSPLKEWMSGTDYLCRRDWVGFGNLVDLYYTEKSNHECISDRN